MAIGRECAMRVTWNWTLVMGQDETGWDRTLGFSFCHWGQDDKRRNNKTCILALVTGWDETLGFISRFTTVKMA